MKFCEEQGKIFTETFRLVWQVYIDDAVGRRWSIEDDFQPEKPLTSTDDTQVKDLVCADSRLTIRRLQKLLGSQ